jgi:hypothetical protein
MEIKSSPFLGVGNRGFIAEITTNGVTPRGLKSFGNPSVIRVRIEGKGKKWNLGI